MVCPGRRTRRRTGRVGAQHGDDRLARLECTAGELLLDALVGELDDVRNATYGDDGKSGKQSSDRKTSRERDLAGFPPVLAFQSAVDATVSTSAVISTLFQRLPEGGHELIVYDVKSGVSAQTR